MKQANRAQRQILEGV